MATVSCLFKACGVLIAIALSIWPIYIFILNEDSIQIQLQDLHSSHDRIYPAFTVCFDRTTFHKFAKMPQSDLGIDMQHQIFSNQSTLKTADFIEFIIIRDFENRQLRLFKNGINFAFDAAIDDVDLSLNSVLRRFQSTSCFAIGLALPNKNGIKSMEVGIKKRIFKDGQEPNRNQMIHGQSQLNIGLSYQQQHFPLFSQDSSRLRSHDSNNHLCSNLIFKVKGMEVISRRDKSSEPCNDYGDYDPIMAINDAAPEVGCLPQGWGKDSVLPICSETQLNSSVRQDLDDILNNYNSKTLLRPCKSIVDVWYSEFIDVIDACTDDKDILHVTVDYDNLQYKEIKFIRAYTLWILIGDITLIFGIFLGVSWQQIPKMMRCLLKTGRKKRRYTHYKMSALIIEIKRNKKEIDALKSLMPQQKQEDVIDV